MQHRISHDLDLATARRATREALESYRKDFQEYSPTGEWLDDDNATVQFTVMGKTLRGAVSVAQDAVTLELKDIPFMFRPFRSAAIKVIDEEIRAWLDKAKAGKLQG